MFSFVFDFATCLTASLSPWAKGHTWQSWREYYKKNQNELDRKIRIHQKEQAKKAQPMEEAPESTHMGRAREESEALRLPPKVPYMNQPRNAQAGESRKNNATKNTYRETAQQAASGRVEAAKQKVRVEQKRMERSGDANISSESTIGGKSRTNVLNTSKGNTKHWCRSSSAERVTSEERATHTAR